ncbi:hypothetical protein EP7_005307 [Isosphaeraceae bacterium EP7]
MPTLTVPGLTAIAGYQFSGQIATLDTTDVSGASVADLKATINWGDSQTSVDVPVALISGTSLGVLASHTYSTPSTYTVGVNIAVRGIGTTSAAGTATVTASAAPSIVVTPTVFTATAGQLATGAVVSTFTDGTSKDLAATSYRAVVQWGDGQTSEGLISTPVNNIYTVTADNVYAAPGSYSVTTSITRLTDGQIVRATGTAVVAAQTFSGQVVGIRGGAVADNRPTFEGKADPFSFVRITAVGPGIVGTLVLGQTVASPAGVWNLQVGPLADGIYTVTATVNAPGGFPERSSLIGEQGRLVVDTIGPQVVSVGYDRLLNQIILVTRDVGVGLNLASLGNAGNFAVTRPSRRVPLGFVSNAKSSPTDSVPLNNPNLVRTVITPSSPLAPGRYNLRLAAGGITDRVGNCLQGPSVLEFVAARRPQVRRPR